MLYISKCLFLYFNKPAWKVVKLQMSSFKNSNTITLTMNSYSKS